MEIKHEITNFNSSTGSLTVKYYTDDFPQGLEYNIDVPIIDGKFVGKDEIDAMIEFSKPKGQLERIVTTAKIETPDFLKQYIKEEPTIQATTEVSGVLDDPSTLAIKNLIESGNVEEFMKKISDNEI
jgi:hypothetical protein